MENINIKDIIGNIICTESADGQKLYAFIDKALKENNQITISFQDVKILTVGFLNTAFGRLYRDYSDEKINSCFSVENLSACGTVTLKRCIETSKLHDKFPKTMKQNINDILEI